MRCARARSPSTASALLGLFAAAACATAPEVRSTVREVPREGAPPPALIAPRPTGRTFSGLASWYGKEQQGGPTASGERFDMNALTAAHRTLKMGTRVRCTSARNGRSVVVRINDRGPYSHGRVIDLSFAAARALDMIDAGVVRVECEVLP